MRGCSREASCGATHETPFERKVALWHGPLVAPSRRVDHERVCCCAMAARERLPRLSRQNGAACARTFAFGSANRFAHVVYTDMGEPSPEPLYTALIWGRAPPNRCVSHETHTQMQTDSERAGDERE